MDELRKITRSSSSPTRCSRRRESPSVPPIFTWVISIEVGATDQVFTNPQHQLTEDYITGRFG